MRPFDDDFDFEPDDGYTDVALLVAGAREFPGEEFARELDARVARRFAPAAPPPGRRVGRRRWARPPRWAAGPAALVVAGLAAAVVVVSGAASGSPKLALHARQNGAGQTPARSSASPGKLLPATHGGAAGSNTSAGSSTSAGSNTAAGVTKSQTFSSAGVAAPPASASVHATSAPVPASSTGGKQIQSAQISLTTPNQHVEQVSSEVLNVVSFEHGTVTRSQITAATRNSGGGYATFRLSVPTGNLEATMTQLSRLRYADVSSRTDASQNVSNQYSDDQRQLADAKALRASLLKQLETAYTQSAIDSIKAQLKLAEQQIDGWQSTLTSLQHRISYSNVTVQINSGGLPVIARVKSSGFTLNRAVHDAGRVLVVSAGVALIALAVLVPVGLVVALLMWLWVWLRQRRREHALDAVE